MCTVAAWVDNDDKHVYIGAACPSRGDCGDNHVFRLGESLFGFPGWTPGAQAVRYRLKLPKHPSATPDEEYMATTFADAVGSAAWSIEPGLAFLMTYRGRVYIARAGLVVPVNGPAEALGDRAEMVKGALLGAARFQMAAADRVPAALDVPDGYAPGMVSVQSIGC